MSAIDTLSLQRRLKEAGFAEGQATAVTEVIQSAVTGYAVTKHDLESALNRQSEKLTTRFGLMLGAAMTLLFLALEYTP